MTTSTALGLPVPEDSDALSDAALAMRNLAAALDQKIIRKSADQSVTNSIALVNDTELTVPVAANKTYFFELTLLASAGSAAADLRTALTFPAGGRLDVGVSGAELGATTNIAQQSTNGASAPASAFVTGAFGLITAATSIRIAGTYVGGVTAGNLTLQWAQFTATAGIASKVLQGSVMKVQVIP